MAEENVVIVIPTYNEADNVSRLVDYLCTTTFPAIESRHVVSHNYKMMVLVVDANSPDGTSKVIKEMAKRYPNVFLLTEEKKEGIGAAYIKGFKYAVEKLKADYLFEFDGDFQHPPETIATMLKTTEEGYDYVIGSRKIEGGSNPKGWELKRLLFSMVGGLLVRFIMFFPYRTFWQVTDPTTGLKVTRVKGFIDRLNLDADRLYSKSFGYKLQLLNETLKLGARFKEIPLRFQLRTSGESKIDAETAKEIFSVAIKVRYSNR